jgi:MraZ protein
MLYNIVECSGVLWRNVVEPGSPSREVWGAQLTMFSGECEHTIDDKGRLIIPAKFRTELAEGLFVTRGLDGCLFVFPPDKWKEMSEKMANLSLVQSSARLFSRMIYSGIECKLDKQGRILLPPSLRAHADIENEVVINGVWTRLEIWSKKRWQKQTTRMEEESSVMAEHLADLGL